MNKVANWLIFSAIVLLALVFRTFHLDQRVLHNDEANQMVRAGVLQERGEYVYDPVEHHGPTLYYLSMPLVRLVAGKDFSITTVAMFRIVPAVFGVGIILLMLFVRDGLGWGATLTASFLTAISTCMVYYGRFYIQETLLVFFTFGAIVCGWQYFRRETAPWAVAVGVFLGLMHATKETCVIAYAAMLIAFVVTWMWTSGFKLKAVNFIVLPLHILYMVLTALIVSIVLFSSFFKNPAGVWDSVATYQVYFNRGSGGNTDHVYPFYYYLKILCCHVSGGLKSSEAVILFLGLIGVVMVAGKYRCIKKVDAGFGCFIVIYTLVMTFAYSAIPYKTPWCMMSFLHGWILLAGIGVYGMFYILRHRALRIAWCLALVYMAYMLSAQTCRANFRYSADYRNPYAYAHTVSDFLNLTRRIDDISAFSENGKSMMIVVASNPQDAWPLPWYLKQYDRVGYWTDVSTIPDDLNPAVIVASLEMEDALMEKTAGKYQAEYWGLRVEVPLALYIRSDLWDRFIEQRTAASDQQ